jgi:hypothetical protein
MFPEFVLSSPKSNTCRCEIELQSQKTAVAKANEAEANEAEANEAERFTPHRTSCMYWAGCATKHYPMR